MLLILIIWLLPATQVLRLILGLPFLLYFPGYTLISALFPKTSDLDDFQRAALPFGLSVAVVPLIGLILNFAWEIDLLSVIVSVAIYSGAMSVIGYYRRLSTPFEERFLLQVNLALPIHKYSSRLDKTITMLLLLFTMAIIVTLSYAIAMPRDGEKYAEFYILGMEAKADLYPKEILVNTDGNISVVKYGHVTEVRPNVWEEVLVEVPDDKARIMIGIKNHEQETATYMIGLSAVGVAYNKIGPIELQNNEKWEEEVGFVLSEICANTKLIEEVNPGSAPGINTCNIIQLESIDHLEVGDHLWIENEFTQVRSISDNIIGLTEPLSNVHLEGAVVKEVQKVEMRLYRVRELGGVGEKNTRFSLWLGTRDLIAEVTNNTQTEAIYWIDVKVEGNEGRYRKDVSTLKDSQQLQASQVGWIDVDVSTEQVTIAPGQTWEPILDYILPEANKVNVECYLYRDGKLIYEEKRSSIYSYPSLHLWIHIKEAEVM